MWFTQWVVLRVMHNPLPKSSKDEQYFLMLPQLFAFFWPATGQAPSRKGARTLLHFCLPFGMQKSPLWSWPLLIRGKETCSLGFCWGISDSYEKPDRNHTKKQISISVILCTSAVKPSACFALLQFTEVTEDHWWSILQIHCLLCSETWTRNPKALKVISRAWV